MYTCNHSRTGLSIRLSALVYHKSRVDIWPDSLRTEKNGFLKMDIRMDIPELKLRFLRIYGKFFIPVFN